MLDDQREIYALDGEAGANIRRVRKGIDVVDVLVDVLDLLLRGINVYYQ